MSDIKAKNPDNQPIVDALYKLSEAETGPNDKKNAGSNMQRAAYHLAQLEQNITSGRELLSKGPDKKIEGIIDEKIAHCIDEFLKSGTANKIDLRETREKGDTIEVKGQEKEQDKKDLEYHEKKGTDPPCLKDVDDGYFPDDSEKEEDDVGLRKKRDGSSDSNDEIYIDRAPALTLWVTIVSERQGYSYEEALTYGWWISGMMVQSKGRALGILEKKDKTDKSKNTKEPKSKSQRTETGHVEVFQNIEIPIENVSGRKVAVESDMEPIKPENVQEYLERAFGNHDLNKAMGVMRKLANSVPQEELKDKAYEIYEMIRPEWQGWGKAGTLDLNKIHDLTELKKETTA